MDRSDRGGHQVQVHHPQTVQVHPQSYYQGGGKSVSRQDGPSATKVMAVLAGIPIGGTLLAIAGLTLAGSLIGLLVATPLFIIFSPILVPALIIVGLAVTGFLASGAFGLTGLSSMSWILNYLRQANVTVPDTMAQVKQHMGAAVAYTGQKTQEVGQMTEEAGQKIESKGREGQAHGQRKTTEGH